MLDPAAGTMIADRYRLERQLGEGGMGSVWAAVDEKLRREVAIKLVTERIADSERALSRFEREAMAVARLRSPYIAQVYDYGVQDGSPYIIMELLEGEDLKVMLARQGRLSVEDTARIVVQVAKALHAAHATGIVHRDLKPANVFLSRGHGEEVCKVFDFGVAKALNDLADDSDTTAEGVLLGTPRYMSPEQAHGAKLVDHRSDLWALGVIAYLCVTGRLPFVAVGTGAVLVKICTEPAPAPSEVVEGLPPEVDAYFEKALAKDPEQRFQSAKEMGTTFADLCDMSLSSFTLGSRSDPRPSWGDGAGSVSGDGDPLDFSDASSISIRGDASLSGSRAAPGSMRSVGSGDDGTLGPATTSVDGRGGWLASRRARIGAGVAAAIAMAFLGGVIALRAGRSGPAEGAVASEGAASEPSATTTPDSSSALPSGEEVASTEVDEGAAAEAEDAEAEDAEADGDETSAPAQPRPPRPVAVEPKSPPKPEPSAEPKATPEPPPKAKPKGDGLDLFDKRW